MWYKILAILLVVGIVNLLLFRAVGITGVVVGVIGLIGAVWLVVGRLEVWKRQIWSLGPLTIALLALAGNAVGSDNGMVQFVSLASMLGLGGLVSYLLLTGKNFVDSLGELVWANIQLISSYGLTALDTGLAALSGELGKRLWGEHFRPHAGFKAVVAGVVVGLPIVGLLTILLAGADPVFANFVTGLISWEKLGELPVRVGVSAVLVLALIPVLLMKLTSHFHQASHEFQSKLKMGVETITVLTMVGLLFAVFLTVQWPYVFVSVVKETDLAAYGVATYSEYVRRGFGELVIVSFLLYGLLSWGVIVAKSTALENRLRPLLVGVQSIVMAEFMLFVASIFRRVWLYQSYHGWSVVRLYGLLVLVWIMGMAGLMFARLWAHKRWVVWETIFSVIVVLILGWFNTEHFLASSHPPTVNRRVDYVYLSRLSADGYVGWEQAMDYVDQTLVVSRWEDKTILDKNDRRTIAYAGWVLENLTRKYHRMVSVYGTLEQRQKYYTEIAKTLQPESSMTPDWHLAEKQLIVPRMVASWDQVFLGEQGRLGRSSFYVRNPGSTSKSLDNLSKLWLSNRSEAAAYQRFTREYGVDKLLQLQARFFAAYTKIVSQPADERFFEMDISDGFLLRD